MRRLAYLTLTVVALLATALVASASAKTIRGTAKAEVLRGTASADKIYGGGGNDEIYGLGGNDYFYPGAGIDVIYCGAGIDHVLADVKDKVAKDCEIVIRPRIEIPPQPTQGSRTNPSARQGGCPGRRLEAEGRVGDARCDRAGSRRERFQRSADSRLAVLHRPGDRHPCLARLGPVRGPHCIYRTVGAAAVSYSGFENSCGEVPDELSEAELFTGGTITGNVCWAIRSSDAASLVLYDDPVQTVSNT